MYFTLVNRTHHHSHLPQAQIYTELASEYGADNFKAPKHGYLGAWADQGVLLLNAALTVRAEKANSHAKRGWETFTERVIEAVDK